MLPLLALGIVLLAGVLGTVAWCAGEDECALIGAGSAAPTPVAEPDDDDEEEPRRTRRPRQTAPRATLAPPVTLPPPTAEPTAIATASPSPTVPPATPVFLRHPSEVAFENVFLGQNVAQETLTIFGSAPVPLQLALLQPTPGAFSAETGCEWAPRGADLFECPLTLTFDPLKPGDYEATLAIVTSEPEPRMVRLVGRAFAPID